jgi:hypothetical protein
MYSILDPNEDKNTGKLERCTADARGPFELGQLSGLLARRQAGGVRVR